MLQKAMCRCTKSIGRAGPNNSFRHFIPQGTSFLKAPCSARFCLCPLRLSGWQRSHSHAQPSRIRNSPSPGSPPPISLGGAPRPCRLRLCCLATFRRCLHPPSINRCSTIPDRALQGSRSLVSYGPFQARCERRRHSHLSGLWHQRRTFSLPAISSPRPWALCPPLTDAIPSVPPRNDSMSTRLGLRSLPRDSTSRPPKATSSAYLET